MTTLGQKLANFKTPSTKANYVYVFVSPQRTNFGQAPDVTLSKHSTDTAGPKTQDGREFRKDGKNHEENKKQAFP